MTDTAISVPDTVAPSRPTAPGAAGAGSVDELAFAALLAALVPPPIVPTIELPAAADPSSVAAAAVPPTPAGLVLGVSAPPVAAPPIAAPTAEVLTTAAPADGLPTPDASSSPTVDAPAAADDGTPVHAPPAAPTAPVDLPPTDLLGVIERAARPSPPDRAHAAVALPVPVPTSAPSPTVDAVVAPAPRPPGDDPSPSPTTTTSTSIAPLAGSRGIPDVAPTAAPTRAGGAAPPDPASQLVRVLSPLRSSPDGVHELALELRPEGMGRVHLDVRVEAGVVHVSMAAEIASTADVLSSRLGDLRAGLEAAGLVAGRLAVGPDASGRRQRRPEQADAGSLDRSEGDVASAPVTPASRPVAAGGLDLLL